MEFYPRLCCLRLRDDYNGYGFSLVATKNEVGQYIDEVKENSPAARAGLKNADIIFEVNGENILTYSHQKVVECIRKNPREVSFLVLDAESRNHYDNASILVHGQLKEVVRLCSWDYDEGTVRNTPTTNNIYHSNNDEKSVQEKAIQNGNSSNLCVAVTGKSQHATLDAESSLGVANTMPNSTTDNTTTKGMAIIEPIITSPIRLSSAKIPSRKERMMANSTFGDRAKVFDEL